MSKMPLGQKIKITSIYIEKFINHRMVKITPNLTPQQTMVMMTLYEKPTHQQIQKEIELQLKTSHATTRGIIKRLEEAGLVMTSQSIDDRRQSVVKLTQKGLSTMSAKYNEINHIFEIADQQLCKNISKEDLKVFSRVLDQMLGNF